MSKGAAERLSELRFRRLLQLELDDVASVERLSVGSLEGDDLIRVWIDVPVERRAVIEVRRVDGSFARRGLGIGEFPSDVAAEAVAVAASEMVRVQERVQKPPCPPPSPEPPHDAPTLESLAVSGAASSLVFPTGAPVFLLGPELGVELRHGPLGHRLYGRWQLAVDAPNARWLEVGAAIDFRWHLADAWRVHVGAKGGFVDVTLPEARRIAAETTTHAWNVRLAGELGLEARVAPGSWLHLSVEPGAALRTLPHTQPSGEDGELGGFALGINLGLIAAPFEDAP